MVIFHSYVELPEGILNYLRVNDEIDVIPSHEYRILLGRDFQMKRFDTKGGAITAIKSESGARDMKHVSFWDRSIKLKMLPYVLNYIIISTAS